MSFAVAGLATKNGLSIDDIRPVETSFPGFDTLMKQLAS